MYAVIEQGGKQYKVAQGDQLDIELTEIAPDAKKLNIDKVLLISDGKDVKIGTPYIDGAKVTASFDDTAEQAVVKGQKLYPMHFRRRKNSRRRIGHRQKFLRVRIGEIKA
ncbi:MAG: 50S ribosomal protein L21 [Sedimentisphaerales bacterium]|nr:50S ribosomal protein L21 [Sedimentisphaerales bacterium]